MSDANQSPDVNQADVNQADVPPIKEEIVLEEEEEDDDSKYDRLVKISLYVSAWLLSCVLLYTYNSKRSANIEYNKLITKVNTNKLNDQIKKYHSKCAEYINLAYPINAMTSVDEVDPSGLTRAKKDVYTELIKSIEIYDKCNFIKINTSGSPFPMSEIIISCLILILIIGFIAVSNFTNNPFKKMNIDGEINEIKEMIMESTKSLSTKASSVSTKGQKGGSSNNVTSTQILDELNRKDMEISTRINFLKSDATFNYVSLSFTVLIFSFYISFKMFMSSLRFKENLYSGSMFMNSRCYDF
jgi:ATP-dependent Zn protease